MQHQIKDSNINFALQELLKTGSMVYYYRKSDSSYPIAFVSENAAEVLGFDSKALSSDPSLWFKQVHPEDQVQIKSKISNLCVDESVVVEYRFKHKAGYYIWLRDEMKLVKKEDGRDELIVGMVVEITKLKETKSKEQERQKLQELAFDNLNDMVIITKALRENPLESSIVFVNKAFEQFTGYQADEVTGKKPTFLHGPETSDEVLRRINQKIKQHESLREEFINYRKDGTPYWIELDMASFPTDDEKYEYWVGINRDITQRKKAEKKIEESEKRHRTFSDLSFDAIFEVDVDGYILKCNKRACELFGYEQSELIGMHVLELTPKQYHDKQPETFIDISTTGDEAWERLYKKKDGTVFPTEIHTAFYNIAGQKRLIAYVRDNTEHKEYENAIRKSLREKETLLAEVHHRVKNNLAIISGLLQMQVFNTDDEQLLAKLKESQSRIQSIAMVHEKLYSSESFSEIAIDRYINDLLYMIEGSMSDYEKEIKVEKEMDSVLLTVGQAIPCGLLLNELITNCYKHAFAGRHAGTIQISIKQYNSMIELSVADNGVGLPDGFNIEEEVSLGMTIIKTLTNQLDGKLEIETNDNETCFTVSFEIEGDY